jgi:hypothetical protein
MIDQIDWSVPPDPTEIEQLREVAKLPFSEKMKWLAQAQGIVESLQRNHQQRLEERRGLKRNA